MNEQQVRALIQQELQNSQFNVAKVPFHTHNNIDSPSIPLANLNIPAATTIFSGFVNAAGTAGTPFPAGWSLVHTGTGRYTITHNLGTTAYVIMTSVKSAFGSIAEAVTRSTNAMEIDTYNNTSGAVWTATNTDFYFAVIT